MFGKNKGNETDNSWKADKYTAGFLHVTLKLNKPIKDKVHDKFELAMYDDQPTSWPALIKDKQSICLTRANGHSCYNDSDIQECINSTLAREYSMIEFRADNDGNDTWSATINIHEHIVPRWWWVYLVKCDWEATPAGDFIKNDIHYQLWWTQNTTSSWYKELSLNDYYQNTFHSVTPFLTFSLFIIQCISYYLYWNKLPNKGYVHIIIKLLTLLIFLQFLSLIFKMSYWLHLTYSGYKEFGILTFSFLFEISSNVLFLYLLFTIFAFGWRMSIGKLNKKLNIILIIICIIIEIINFIIFIWSYETYPDKETTLYRYSEDPQAVYGVFMLIFGIIWYIILMIASFKDEYNGIFTKIQRNFRLIIGFILLFTWFIWPIIAVGAATSIQKNNTSLDRVDFVCDVLSWCFKILSFFILVGITHPVNPFHERTFDFNKEMVHARYVKNSMGMNPDQIFDDSDDDDDDNPAGQNKSELQMNEIKKSTVFSTKLKKKKKDKKDKKKLFKYSGRNQIAQDSDEDSDELSDQDINVEVDDDDDSDNSDDDDQDNVYAKNNPNKGNNIAISAVSVDAARETLKGGE